MRVIFEGDTPYFPITVLNSNGTTLDVTDKSIVTNLILSLYSLFAPEKILARFALYPTGEYSGHEEISTYSDNSMGIILPQMGVKNLVNHKIVLQTTLILNSSIIGKEDTGAESICEVIPKY